MDRCEFCGTSDSLHSADCPTPYAATSCVQLSATRAQHRALRELQATGLYGKDYATVATEIFARGLRAAIAEKRKMDEHSK